MQITRNDGVADIIAMETRSARPIEDNIAMAMAAIPREGISYVLAGKNTFPYQMIIKRSFLFELGIYNVEIIASASILTIFTVLNVSASPTPIQEHTEILSQEFLVNPSTHQTKFREVLRGLAELPYPTRIDQSFFK